MIDFRKSENCAFNIQISNFTSHCKTDKFEFPVIDCFERGIADLDCLFGINVFPNGMCKENKGYLSVMFVCTPEVSYFLKDDSSFFELVCTASVVDAKGDKRFPQSFGHTLEPQAYVELENFGFEKYLKTDTLLSDPSEMLPGDCLTIYMEVIFRRGNLVADIAWFANSEDFFFHDGDKFYFRSDSVVGSALCQHSNVFRRMSEIPMIEKEKNRLYFVPQESGAIGRIFDFITGTLAEIPLDEYISFMLEIYVVAEKYDIELVLEDCRLRLESFLNSISDWKSLEHVTENIPNILELAETYRDKRLRESAEKFLKNREKIEAHLRNEMQMEPDIKERKPTVCCYGREVSCEQKPQLEHVVSGHEVKPQLDFYT